MAALLSMPAGAAVRLIARGHLGDARAALRRVAAGKGDDALHDLRVALRRLRGCLRAYWPTFAPTVRKKHRRRLTALARATGESRDAAVLLALVQRYRGEASEQERERWLRSLQSRGDAAIEDRIGEQLTRVLDRIERGLAWYPAPLPGPDGSVPDPFGRSAAAQVRAAASLLAARLAATAGVEQASELHRARIAGKRLRYLLEPLAQEIDGVAPIVARLKALQDVLGDLHDHQVLLASLADDDPLAERAQATTLELFALFRATFGHETEADLTAVERVAARLEEAARAGVERERKYLLRALPDVARAAAWHDIEQGWLPGAVLQERLRRQRGQDGTETFTRTVKLGRGVQRIEVEEACDAELFARLWPLTEGRRIRKRRHVVVEADGTTWEIDVFPDRDLLLAEVELDGADDEPPVPAWLAPAIVREVTGESEFVNRILAR